MIDKPDLLKRCQRAGGGATSQHRLFVPGRLELAGKHTDYAGGRSLVCAIERGIVMLVSPRADAIVRMTDAISSSNCQFVIDPELAPAVGHWSNYPMTVARRVARNFPGPLRGADIALASDLPPAAGLSSSSALIVGMFLALDAVNDLRQRREYGANICNMEDLAGYLATVENGQSFGALAGDRGVGTFGGSQDHTAILCARAGMLSQFGYCPGRRERDVPMPADHVFVVGVSGVVAEKTRAALESFNRGAQLVTEILRHWQESTSRADPTVAAAVRSARDAPERLRQILRGGTDSQDLLDRLEQFLEESERIVPAAGDALEQGDLRSFGELVARSQDMCERLLKNQVPETIALVRLARGHGAVAASAFGAGFGGSVWAMVRRDAADEFGEDWCSSYLVEFPHRRQDAMFFVTTAGCAATSF